MQHQIQALALSDVAGSGKHPLQLAISVIKGAGIVGNDGFHRRITAPIAMPLGLAMVRPNSCARGQLIVNNLIFRQDPLDARFGPVWVGEIVFKRRADQLVAGATG